MCRGNSLFRWAELTIPRLHSRTRRDWPRFNAVYSEILGDIKPARSIVPVPELHYGYLVEIDALAAEGRDI
jgi:enamine deaminase RidA (YjgF/YER057c/UK114 family)